MHKRLVVLGTLVTGISTGWVGNALAADYQEREMMSVAPEHSASQSAIREALPGSGAAPRTEGPPAPMEVYRRNGVAYITGGIGDAEQQVLKTLDGQFNLKLTFATQAGKYLSDVRVQIKDAQDTTVLDTISNGPLLLAELEPGFYSVEVSGFGQEFQKQARISQGRQTQLIFRWQS